MTAATKRRNDVFAARARSDGDILDEDHPILPTVDPGEGAVAVYRMGERRPARRQA